MSAQPLMHPESIVVAGEDFQLPIQFHSVPEEHPVKILPAYCPDAPLHKRVRNGHVGHAAVCPHTIQRLSHTAFIVPFLGWKPACLQPAPFPGLHTPPLAIVTGRLETRRKSTGRPAKRRLCSAR